MYMPAARDDLSILGDDIFSDLIRQSYSEKNTSDKATGAGGRLGPSRIDKEVANKIAQELMLGKSVQEILELFSQGGGQCSSLVLVTERLLKCEIIRKWKLKNIGASIDTSNWSEPAAKLFFQFMTSDSNVIRGVHIEIIDVTEYKKIYTKQNIGN